MAVQLFVYGTLTEQRRLHRLTGKSFSVSPALLKDYKKETSRLGYPIIFPAKGACVEGLLIKNIDDASLKKLDEYEDEGRLYFRKKVTVVCEGKEVVCEAYVGNREGFAA